MNNIYSIILGFLETEKSVKKLQPLNKYTFLVNPTSSKVDVANAVSSLYNVEVIKVNTIPVRKKTRMVWRWKLFTKRRDGSKAIVTIKEWQKIDFADIKDQK